MCHVVDGGKPDSEAIMNDVSNILFIDGQVARNFTFKLQANAAIPKELEVLFSKPFIAPLKKPRNTPHNQAQRRQPIV
ncbi:unnamed protein product [Clavelina lepadiformis]|uniref:Uncharacterized protein n=1 Tax=Clavelina lepadiformis TaxID=159417 RepID=A0ABP0GGN2_CLALP